MRDFKCRFQFLNHKFSTELIYKISPNKNQSNSAIFFFLSCIWEVFYMFAKIFQCRRKMWWIAARAKSINWSYAVKWCRRRRKSIKFQFIESPHVEWWSHKMDTFKLIQMQLFMIIDNKKWLDLANHLSLHQIYINHIFQSNLILLFSFLNTELSND